MKPQPVTETPYEGSWRLRNKKCVVTGGDSGIGRAVAVAFAKEGADVAIVYLKSEEKDAKTTAELIKEQHGKKCMLVQADFTQEQNCRKAAQAILDELKTIDVLVNNAGVHYPEKSLEDITSDHLVETFTVNILAMFWFTQEILKGMKKGGAIINTTSVTAYRGSGGLIDYSATKGAIVSFTRSLSANLAQKNIRVNAVAPGPIWTPLIPASFDAKHVSEHGSETPLGRAGQPGELAPAYVYLACEDSSYVTGQVIHVNGGEIVNG